MLMKPPSIVEQIDNFSHLHTESDAKHSSHSKNKNKKKENSLSLRSKPLNSNRQNQQKQKQADNGSVHSYASGKSKRSKKKQSSIGMQRQKGTMLRNNSPMKSEEEDIQVLDYAETNNKNYVNNVVEYSQVKNDYVPKTPQNVYQISSFQNQSPNIHNKNSFKNVIKNTQYIPEPKYNPLKQIDDQVPVYKLVQNKNKQPVYDKPNTNTVVSPKIAERTQTKRLGQMFEENRRNMQGQSALGISNVPSQINNSSIMGNESRRSRSKLGQLFKDKSKQKIVNNSSNLTYTQNNSSNFNVSTSQLKVDSQIIDSRIRQIHPLGSGKSKQKQTINKNKIPEKVLEQSIHQFDGGEYQNKQDLNLSLSKNSPFTSKIGSNANNRSNLNNRDSVCFNLQPQRKKKGLGVASKMMNQSDQMIKISGNLQSKDIGQMKFNSNPNTYINNNQYAYPQQNTASKQSEAHQKLRSNLRQNQKYLTQITTDNQFQQQREQQARYLQQIRLKQQAMKAKQRQLQMQKMALLQRNKLQQTRIQQERETQKRRQEQLRKREQMLRKQQQRREQQQRKRQAQRLKRIEQQEKFRQRQRQQQQRIYQQKKQQQRLQKLQQTQRQNQRRQKQIQENRKRLQKQRQQIRSQEKNRNDKQLQRKKFQQIQKIRIEKQRLKQAYNKQKEEIKKIHERSEKNQQKSLIYELESNQQNIKIDSLDKMPSTYSRQNSINGSEKSNNSKKARKNKQSTIPVQQKKKIYHELSPRAQASFYQQSKPEIPLKTQQVPNQIKQMPRKLMSFSEQQDLAYQPKPQCKTDSYFYDKSIKAPSSKPPISKKSSASRSKSKQGLIQKKNPKSSQIKIKGNQINNGEKKLSLVQLAMKKNYQPNSGSQNLSQDSFRSRQNSADNGSRHSRSNSINSSGSRKKQSVINLKHNTMGNYNRPPICRRNSSQNQNSISRADQHERQMQSQTRFYQQQQQQRIQRQNKPRIIRGCSFIDERGRLVQKGDMLIKGNQVTGTRQIVGFNQKKMFERLMNSRQKRKSRSRQRSLNRSRASSKSVQKVGSKHINSSRSRQFVQSEAYSETQISQGRYDGSKYQSSGQQFYRNSGYGTNNYMGVQSRTNFNTGSNYRPSAPTNLKQFIKPIQQAGISYRVAQNKYEQPTRNQNSQKKRSIQRTQKARGGHNY